MINHKPDHPHDRLPDSPPSEFYNWSQYPGGIQMELDQLVAAHKHLGLTIAELAIMVNHRAETAASWESIDEVKSGHARSMPAAVVKNVAWMLNGYRSHDWPERLSETNAK